MVAPSSRRRLRALSAATLGLAVAGAFGLYAAGCGPVLTVAGIAGIAALNDGSRDAINRPPAVAITTPAGVVNDVIAVSYRLTDPEDEDRADVLVEYSRDGGPFQPTTQAFVEGAEGTTNLVADETGTDHVYFWNSTQDLSTENVTGIRLRITPSARGGGSVGEAETSETFSVFNRFVTTLASQSASFKVQVAGMAVDGSGNLVMADASGSRVMRLNKTLGTSSVLAGTGVTGFVGGGVPGTSAQLNVPLGVGVQPDGDVIVADFLNFRLRRIEAQTGFVEEVGGGGDLLDELELGVQSFLFPRDLAIDASGNPFVLSDEGRVRVLNLQGSTALAVPKGTSNCNELNQFTGTSVSVNASRLWSVVGGAPNCGNTGSSSFTQALRNGAAIAFSPGSGSERVLYVIDAGEPGQNNLPALSVVNMGTASIGVESLITNTTLTIQPGDFAVVARRQQLPSNLGDFLDLAVAQSGVLLLAAPQRHQLFAINLTTSGVTLAGTLVPARSTTAIAGTGTPGFGGDGLQPLAAGMFSPVSVTVDSSGSIFVGEILGRMRVFAGSSGYSTGTVNVAANRTGTLPVGVPDTSASVVQPGFMTLAPDGDFLVTDSSLGDSRSNRLLRVDSRTGVVTPVLGGGTFGDSGDGTAATSAGVLLGSLGNPAINAEGSLALVADFTHSRVRAVNLSTQPLTFLGTAIAPGQVQTVVGTGAVTSGTAVPLGDGGAASQASLNAPSTVSFDARGLLWIGDSRNHRVRVANPTGASVEVLGVTIGPNQIQTVAGNGMQGAIGDDGEGGSAGAAKLETPGVVMGPQGNAYVVDGQDFRSRVRLINLQSTSITVGGVTIAPGAIGTLVGSGAMRLPDQSNLGDGGAARSATFRGMSGLSVTPSGLLWVSDSDDHRVRVVNLSSEPRTLRGVTLAPATIQTALGTGIPGFAGEPGDVGQAFSGGAGAGPLEEPQGVIAFDDGRVIFADRNNGALRLANFGESSQRFGGAEAAPGKVVVVAGSRSGRLRAQTPAEVIVDSLGRVIFTDIGRLGDRPAVLQLDPNTRLITRIAGGLEDAQGLGDGGPAVLSTVNDPRGLALDSAGSLFVSDRGNRRVRFVNRTNATVTPSNGLSVRAGDIATVVDGSAGDGDQNNDQGAAIVGGGLDLSAPVAVSVSGSTLWIADEAAERLLRVDLSAGVVAGILSRTPVLGPRSGTLAGMGQATLSDAGLTFATSGVQEDDIVRLLSMTNSPEAEVAQIDEDNDRLLLNSAAPSTPTAVTYSVERSFPAGAVVALSATEAYVAINFPGHAEIKRVTFTGGTSFTVAAVAGTANGTWNGDIVTATSMNFAEVSSLTLDGSLLFASDAQLHRVVAINTGSSTQTVAGLAIAAGEARTICGGGQGRSGFNGDAVPPNLALLNRPTGVALDPTGGVLVVDQGNGRLRRFQR